MADVAKLIERIDAEFLAAEKQVKQFQEEKTAEHRDRQDRLTRYEQLLQEMTGIWRPRLEALADRFNKRVQVTPTVSPARREAAFKFQSPVARIDLRLSVSPDMDVRNVVFACDLEILPILMEFEKHSQIMFPLEAIDRAKLAAWLDDQIVKFVHTYLEVHQNQYYLKDHLVEDPIAKVKFPKYAAGAVLESQGQTHYFICNETRSEFERQRAAK